MLLGPAAVAVAAAPDDLGGKHGQQADRQSAALMNEAATQLTIPIETIGVSGTALYISDSVQEPGIDGLARTNLRFS